MQTIEAFKLKTKLKSLASSTQINGFSRAMSNQLFYELNWDEQFFASVSSIIKGILEYQSAE